MAIEDIQDIKRNIDKLFGKINDFGEGLAVNTAVLQRVEKMFGDLPCEKEREKIECHDRDIYAIKNLWLAIVGLLSFIGMILGVLNFILKH